MLTANPQDNTPELLRVCTSDFEAHMIQARLADAGIETIIDNELFSRIYPLPFSSVGGLRLMVRRCDLELALKLIEGLEFPESEE